MRQSAERADTSRLSRRNYSTTTTTEADHELRLLRQSVDRRPTGSRSVAELATGPQPSAHRTGRWRDRRRVLRHRPVPVVAVEASTRSCSPTRSDQRPEPWIRGRAYWGTTARVPREPVLVDVPGLRA